MIDWLLPLAFLVALPVLVINATTGIKGLRPAFALVRRRMQVYRSYPFAVFATAAHALVLILLVITVGRYVFPDFRDFTLGRDGIQYLTYITVGLVAWPAIWEAYELTHRNVRAEQTTGLFETLIATPVGVRVLPLAYLIITLPVTIIAATVAYLVFTHFGGVALPIHGAVHLVNIALVIATGLFMTWGLGLFLGGLTAIVKETGPLGGLLKMLMLVFSNVYIPIAVFPQAIQTFSNILPLTWAFASIRHVFAGEPVTADLTTYVVFFAYTFALVLGGLYVFQRAIERARQDGTTGGY